MELYLYVQVIFLHILMYLEPIYWSGMYFKIDFLWP